MKVINGSFIALGIAGMLAGCGSSTEPAAAPAPVEMEARVSAAQATPEIAAAECEREMKCNQVGDSLKYSSLDHCKKVRSEDLSKDFNDDDDCKNGISAKSLDECVAKTTDQTCDGLSSMVGNAERASRCGSGDLCME